MSADISASSSSRAGLKQVHSKVFANKHKFYLAPEL